jgi:predicted AlkP superfamily phosphohydrolase/phosphomutase
MGRRLALIGLDCGTPSLLFDRYAAEMPTLTALRERALWGPLRSVVPPITVPAWSCMASGRTPGELGIYGFRNRVDHSYDRLSVATSRAVHVPRLWDLAGEAGLTSVVVGVPGTYPPTPIRGDMVSCFLAPSTRSTFTSPRSLAEEVQRVTGGYVLDVADFRTEDKTRIAQQISDMSEQRFALARHLATTRPWDLMMFVDMGPDRLHHGFWASCDPDHPRHQPGNVHRDLFAEYYRDLDRHLAEFLACLPEDTDVLLVSDHGAQPMLGGFCVNEWLIDHGYLVLARTPAGPTAITECEVDWTRTAAWAEGGYYGRIFLNVEGREPSGTVPMSEYDSVREQLGAELEAVLDHRRHPMRNRVIRPEDAYPEINGFPPDLLVYFDDLRWRAAGKVGLGSGWYTFENDIGPDDANHAELGVFALAGEGLPQGYADDLSLLDVAPTVQTLLGLAAPAGQRGRSLV